MEKPLLIGAVAYDARVVPIWEAMRDYFRDNGPPIDYVLFSNYDRQVEALLARQIDIAWNTNLAWVKVYRRTNGRCRALAMRDVDVRYKTVIVARADSGIAKLPDIRGKRFAVGSADSAQAAILPIHYLMDAGFDPRRECALTRFDLDVGKHGDTGTSELEVLRALREGNADAGALGEPTWAGQLAKGNVDARQFRVISTSPGYCHCNFTSLDELPDQLGRSWTESLLGMRYDRPRCRELMDLEGLKRWVAPDDEALKGYDVLFEAVRRQGLEQLWPK
jgi:ABC-type phosphate/phosphonate transport system substrate-binding protein